MADVKTDPAKLIGDYKAVYTAMKNRKNVQGTPFSWKTKEINENCTWQEFQQKTSGNNTEKAIAYHMFTGRKADVSARQEYMGSTPSKDSPTGREVIARMYLNQKERFRFKSPENRKEEKLCKICATYLEMVVELYDKKQPIPVLPIDQKEFMKLVILDDEPLTKYDMGHKNKRTHPKEDHEDAVIMWDKLFRYLGEEKGKEVARKWMKLSEIYELQLSGPNRSEGASVGYTYGRPEKHEVTDEKLKEYLEWIDEEYDRYFNKYGKRK